MNLMGETKCSIQKNALSFQMNSAFISSNVTYRKMNLLSNSLISNWTEKDKLIKLDLFRSRGRRNRKEHEEIVISFITKVKVRLNNLIIGLDKIVHLSKNMCRRDQEKKKWLCWEESLLFNLGSWWRRTKLVRLSLRSLRKIGRNSHCKEVRKIGWLSSRPKERQNNGNKKVQKI